MTADPDRGHRYAVGDRVRVRERQPDGNPRAPLYVRGKVGTVVQLHGGVSNPIDHRGVYPPLCTVRFELGELTGRASPDAVTADLHEDWLEPG